MSGSVLKKEFQKRDVERLRNLVKGKHGNKTTVGIGYQGEQEEEHQGEEHQREEQKEQEESDQEESDQEESDQEESESNPNKEKKILDVSDDTGIIENIIHTFNDLYVYGRIFIENNYLNLFVYLSIK